MSWKGISSISQATLAGEPLRRSSIAFSPQIEVDPIGTDLMRVLEVQTSPDLGQFEAAVQPAASADRLVAIPP
jgi:hypothetical protein